MRYMPWLVAGLIAVGVAAAASGKSAERARVARSGRGDTWRGLLVARSVIQRCVASSAWTRYATALPSGSTRRSGCITVAVASRAGELTATTRLRTHSGKGALAWALEGRVVATAVAGYEGHRGWLNYVAVSPEVQKHGLGRAIVAQAEEHLHRRPTVLSRHRDTGAEAPRQVRVGLAEFTGIAVGNLLNLFNPELVVLDEPTNGLDPQGMKEVRELIRSLAHDRQKTIILSSHLLHEVELVANRMAIINQGELKVEGSVDALVRELREETALEARMISSMPYCSMAALPSEPNTAGVTVSTPTAVAAMPSTHGRW